MNLVVPSSVYNAIKESCELCRLLGIPHPDQTHGGTNRTPKKKKRK
jgi:hypothetical protein